MTNFINELKMTYYVNEGCRKNPWDFPTENVFLTFPGIVSDRKSEVVTESQITRSMALDLMDSYQIWEPEEVMSDLWEKLNELHLNTWEITPNWKAEEIPTLEQIEELAQQVLDWTTEGEYLKAQLLGMPMRPATKEEQEEIESNKEDKDVPAAAFSGLFPHEREMDWE